MNEKIWLSPPHITGLELAQIQESFQQNWIAPNGPHTLKFEENISLLTGKRYALAVNSGTSALHLSLMIAAIKEGDEVICQSFTFAASAFPIIYCKAIPIFVDSEINSWNINPELLDQVLTERKKAGANVKAVVIVHIYGNPCDLDEIIAICNKHEVILIEDAAEALGSTYKGAQVGGYGRSGIFSFNGNKIVTTSSGGVLVTDNEQDYSTAKTLANQASEKGLDYHHTRIGYNYRLSNILSAIGVAQLQSLPERVSKRRKIFEFYKMAFDNLPIMQQQELDEAQSNRWITAIVLEDSEMRDRIINKLLEDSIEVRHLMKPLHLQPAFANTLFFGTNVAENLNKTGICLPSGTNLSEKELERIARIVKSCF